MRGQCFLGGSHCATPGAGRKPGHLNAFCDDENPARSELSGLRSLLETELTGCVYVLTHPFVYLLSTMQRHHSRHSDGMDRGQTVLLSGQPGCRLRKIHPYREETNANQLAYKLDSLGFW